MGVGSTVTIQIISSHGRNEVHRIYQHVFPYIEKRLGWLIGFEVWLARLGDAIAFVPKVGIRPELLIQCIETQAIQGSQTATLKEPAIATTLGSIFASQVEYLLGRTLHSQMS